MYNLSEENKNWLDQTWTKLENKLSVIAERTELAAPNTNHDGMYQSSPSPSNWANGFWPGMMLLMYKQTGKEIFLNRERAVMDNIDSALTNYESLHHDVGFIWDITSGADYRITGDEKQKARALTAAGHLMSRYNLKGEFIRAWEQWIGFDVRGWAIIDCMMNLPLLYRASEITGDDRFKMVAMSHADTTMKYHVRPDGSCNHINEYDFENGGYIKSHIGQGYSENSSWSRGQSWGVYGFTLSYIFTGKKEYLDTAKKIANYFIASVAVTDWLPLADFRAPKEPVHYDATAGMCAACGMLELAKVVDENEARLYTDAAVNILKSTVEKCANWDLDKDAIIMMGSECYNSGNHVPIIYGDYFFTEAMLKLKGSDFLAW